VILALAVAALAAMLAWAILQAPLPPVDLATRVVAQAAVTGAEHPVTAVLLGFRAWDTLLEIAVLLLAVLGASAAAGAESKTPAAPPHDPVLRALVNAIVPLMLLVAGYILWAGTKQPGGAFQAGAVLAAAGVLLCLAGRLPLVDPERPALRLGLAGGLAFFLAVFLAGALAGWLLAVEAALTVSIGLALACLFASARQ
jgi:multisubunit Na+/H+ antiporter MnhB subunit